MWYTKPAMKKVIIGTLVTAVIGVGAFVAWRSRAATFVPPASVAKVEGKRFASEPGYFPVPQGLVNPCAAWKKWEARVVHPVFYVQEKPFDGYDPDVPSPLFKVNQVGYLPHAPKFAYVGAWLGPTYGAWKPKKPMTRIKSPRLGPARPMIVR